MLAQPNHLHLPGRAFTLTLSAACLIAAADLAQAGNPVIEVKDDLQRTVSLKSPARRIISLAPHLTELVYSAGAGNSLVGVSRHCDYPPQVAALPRVSDHTTFNYELISRLKPDLVLVWKAGLKDTTLNRLASLYRSVYVSGPIDFGNIAENLIEIGILTGNTVPARRAADSFLHEIDTLAARHTRSQPVKTLYLLWHTPPITVGSNHWISRVITLCGGTNIFASTLADIVTVNRESLRLMYPDVVLHSFKMVSGDPAALIQPLGLPNTNPVFYIESDSVQRPSLRLAQGAAQLCRLIHSSGEWRQKTTRKP